MKVLVLVLVAASFAGCEKQAAPPEQVTTNSARTPEPKSEPTLEQLQAEKATAFVMLGSDSCVNSKSMAPHFDALTTQHPELRFVRTHAEVGATRPTPSFFVLKDGVVMDQQSGAVPEANPEAAHENPLILLNMMARNGLIDQDPSTLLLNDEPAEPPPAWMYEGLGANARRLDGWQMQNQNFKNASFAGASLKNADFRLANLEGVNFSHTDLTGSFLEGASMEGVYWNDTICPDGKVHEFGCAEILWPSTEPQK